MSMSFAPDRSAVPGPSAWLPGGAYWAFRKDPLAFFTNTARAYGDIAAFSFGPQQVYLVSRPEWIEDVLVKSAGKFAKGVALERAKVLLGNGLLTADGQEHLKHRRMIQPLFHRQHVQGFADTMVRHATRWRDQVTPGARLDITREMSGLTLAIIGETMFSSNVQGDADEVREALAHAVAGFGIAFIPGFDYLSRLPLPMFVRIRKARERLDKVIHRVIAQRREHDGPPRGDLISMLLAARDPENPDEGGMGDRQIRDEAMTIFLAGHETTANAMAWTWHLLANAPAVEARLHDELATVLQGRIPTAEDVPQLEWTRAIVSESLRLFPPAWTMGRRVLEDHTIGGHTVARGSLVILSQWVVHRDPRWWPEPERFKPERWIPPSASSVSSAALDGSASSTFAQGASADKSAARPRYAYFPFGGGTRVCIGEAFAWTEAILLLATIAQRWRFVRGTAPAPTTEPRITLRPKGLFMTAAQR